MTRLTTDLIGRIFDDDGSRCLVTDRVSAKSGHAVVRIVAAKPRFVNMPVDEIVRKVYPQH